MGQAIIGIAIVGSFIVLLWRLFKHWYDKRPNFTYKKVKVKYYTIPKEKNLKAARDAKVKEWLDRNVTDGYFDDHKAEQLLKTHYDKLKGTKEMDKAIKKGIDAIQERFPDYEWDDPNLKQDLWCYVQRYPISHKFPQGIITSHGIAYPEHRKFHVTVMPEEKGGLKATSSLIVHELGGHIQLYDTSGNRDVDRKHGKKKFWKKVDAVVE